MKARALLEDGVSWTDAMTRIALPIVLHTAISGDRITYGKLNEAVGRRGGAAAMAITYRFVAGKIGDICEALAEDLEEPVPPLNAIIVNERTKLPSHGVDMYLLRYLGKPAKLIAKMADEDRKAYASQAIEAVHSFEAWAKIGSLLGYPSILGKPLNRGKPIPLPDHSAFSTGPESDAHKALKHWVADHPEQFMAFGAFGKGECERNLSSGDRLDVHFDNGSKSLAVEVKTATASDSEVQRGVYQCVKYRAVLRAMQLAASKPPNGNAVLALDQEPSAVVAQLAERLSVRVIKIDMTSRHRRPAKVT